MFSGSGRFSQTWRQHSHTSQVPIFEMDIVWCADNNLCLRSVAKTIRGWIRGKLLVAVLIATPCSSFSTARNRPGGPRALRTADWPNGLPDLTGADLQKVQVGNSRASVSFLMFMECRRRNIPVLIENPAYSWLWKLPISRNCAKQSGISDTCFWHVCLQSTVAQTH